MSTECVTLEINQKKKNNTNTAQQFLTAILQVQMNQLNSRNDLSINRLLRQKAP